MNVANGNVKNEFNDRDESFKSVLTPTKNSYGFQFEMVNPHFDLSLMSKEKPVVDLATAYGFSSKILLNNGFKVIANDLDERHLNELWNSVKAEQRINLELRPGNVMDLMFAENSLSGIVAIKLIQFLEGEQIRTLFKRFYNWLAPNGFLVIATSSPFIGTSFKNFDDEIPRKYYEKLRNKCEWPGQFFRVKDILKCDKVANNLPENFNLICNDILIREANLAGFCIYKSEYFDMDLVNRRYVRDGPCKQESNIICFKNDL
jgi:predicted SAM-dependent methyltransferase